MVKIIQVLFVSNFLTHVLAVSYKTIVICLCCEYFKSNFIETFSTTFMAVPQLPVRDSFKILENSIIIVPPSIQNYCISQFKGLINRLFKIWQPSFRSSGTACKCPWIAWMDGWMSCCRLKTSTKSLQQLATISWPTAPILEYCTVGSVYTATISVISLFSARYKSH